MILERALRYCPIYTKTLPKDLLSYPNRWSYKSKKNLKALFDQACLIYFLICHSGNRKYEKVFHLVVKFSKFLTIFFFLKKSKKVSKIAFKLKLKTLKFFIIAITRKCNKKTTETTVLIQQVMTWHQTLYVFNVFSCIKFSLLVFFSIFSFDLIDH